MLRANFEVCIGCLLTMDFTSDAPALLPSSIRASSPSKFRMMSSLAHHHSIVASGLFGITVRLFSGQGADAEKEIESREQV